MQIRVAPARVTIAILSALLLAHPAFGAEHWAFVPPKRSSVPDVHPHHRATNPIDSFILAKLNQEGLHPSPEAIATTLIRRATLDLIGLPPTPEEVDAFLNDTSPDAYEHVVDRLLASPSYGERMAVPWLDAARYADTSGYQNDGPRHMWRWRDWVIDALNANMSFDRFTIEQIAGDLLPEPTLEQRIATGFNRNHRGNAEGGLIPEEYAVEYVADRVDTTATVWLGLTVGCARCHDHKYDPISQREFYQMFAFFNNVPEHGRAIKEGNSPPYIPAPTREQQERLTVIERELTLAQRHYRKAEARIAEAQSTWERDINADTLPDWAFEKGQLSHWSLDDIDDKSLTHHGTPTATKGKIADAVKLDGSSWLDTGDVANFGYFDTFTIAAWIRPTNEAGGTIISRMTDVSEGDGYSVVLKDGKIHVHLVKRWLDDAIRVETSEAVIAPKTWQHVSVSYDGSRVADGIRIDVDGVPRNLKVNLDSINQTFATKEPLRIGAGGGPTSRFHGSIDDVRIFRGALSSENVSLVATPDRLRDVLHIPVEERTSRQRAKLRAFFITHKAPDSLRKLHANVEQLRQSRAKLIDSFPTVMVMEEMSEVRPTHLLLRGQYDHPGPGVKRDVPKILNGFVKEAPSDRLGLASWLVDRRNPLTARVTVNQHWQIFFGSGLVRSTEDFGRQGAKPSHPELLDFLAVEFMDGGWDMKDLHRRIATSGTYRQSSRVTPDGIRVDPSNRLLARGPRFRLSAHQIRDQALAASGLLVTQLGGPSVKPYQPAGLWEELSGQVYEQGHGEDLYRRSLYTYWKRTAAPPTMMSFDAADRETCIVRPSRTNTPLQALAIMNGITFVEAARMLAQRVMTECSEDELRLVRLFRLVTSRHPTPGELGILTRSLHGHRLSLAGRATEVNDLMKIGESTPDPTLPKAELAAFTAVANTVLNLDEVITKE